MNASGLIFSNIHDDKLPELTRWRTMASVPCGCRYRLVDFPLSNMVNADITNIGIITHYNYQSLLDHIGTGKDWDLSRRSGGIKILPPFITAYENNASGKVYSTRLEALMGVTNFLSRVHEDYIFLSDCDMVCNIDFADVLRRHIAANAEMTIVTVKISDDRYVRGDDIIRIEADENGRIFDCAEYAGAPQIAEISTNIMVMNREYLINVVADAMAHGYTSFYHDIVFRNLDRGSFYAYRFNGYCGMIRSMASYYRFNMELLNPEMRRELFGIRNRPIYTKVRNSAPTKYCSGSDVANSYIADGCVIKGTVENSILFRDVHVGEGTVVKDCILLQNTYIGSHVSLSAVISDKNAVVKDGRMLAGCAEMPFFLPRGAMV